MGILELKTTQITELLMKNAASPRFSYLISYELSSVLSVCCQRLQQLGMNPTEAAIAHADDLVARFDVVHHLSDYLVN